MTPPSRPKNWNGVRLSPRIHTVREISVDYEGHSEQVPTRPPDISTHGMFINTQRRFPEGAILNLRFRLALSGTEINARCEVRYCLPGVGVEFIRIPAKATRAIEREIHLSARRQSRRRSRKR